MQSLNQSELPRGMELMPSAVEALDTQGSTVPYYCSYSVLRHSIALPNPAPTEPSPAARD
jgi:hypothetical protein